MPFIKSDFYTLEGNLTSSVQVVNFPPSFNWNNCVVLSAMARNTTATKAMWTCSADYSSASYIRGGSPFFVSLTENGIEFSGRNILLSNNVSPLVSDLANYKFRITLMKWY